MRWSLQLREDIGTISWPLQLLHASFAVVLTMDHNAFLWAKGLWALHTSSANIFSFAAALLRCSVTLMLDSIMSDPFGRKLPWWKPVRSMFASMLTVPDAKSLSFFSVMSCCGLWQANDKWLRGGVILISVAVSHSKQTCICECVCVCVCVCTVWRLGTISVGSLFRFQLWLRVNFSLTLLSTLIDLLRLASSVYTIFPYVSLKEDGSSLHVKTKTMYRRDWMSDSNPPSVAP